MLQVLFLLEGRVMTVPVKLNNYLTVKERKICDMLEAWEKELTAVAFALRSDGRLEEALRLGHISEQIVGVLKEHY